MLLVPRGGGLVQRGGKPVARAGGLPGLGEPVARGGGLSLGEAPPRGVGLVPRGNRLRPLPAACPIRRHR